MKKLIFIIFMFVISLGNIYALPSSNFPYQEPHSGSMKDALRQSKMGEMADAYVGHEIQSKKSPISYYISKIINYFLGILAFISFLSLLYGFSLVFTDKTEEGLKRGFKFIKLATIAIVVIGVSWLFSMWIFSIYNHDVVIVD